MDNMALILSNHRMENGKIINVGTHTKYGKLRKAKTDEVVDKKPTPVDNNLSRRDIELQQNTPDSESNTQEYSFSDSITRLKRWLNNRNRNTSYNEGSFVLTVFYIIFFLVSTYIVYNKIGSLNSIVLWFLPLGGLILAISLFLLVILIIKLVSMLPSWFSGQPYKVKCSLIILLALLLIAGYSNRQNLFNKTVKQLSNIDLEYLFSIEVSDNNSLIDELFQGIDETTTPQTISEKTRDIEKAIITYTNAARESNGQENLSLDDKLTIIARAHSVDMAKNDFFSHTNL